ncbi:Phosphatidylinositol 4-kinase pik1alpha (PI4-kinase)(PtdIns-4-kinase) [Coemansia sp. RSA 1824]|nr:Phosphatidylinositol 4-kinase pik1alpha (PI4-kinase)(PtdIns-4-kinase) [Coemansia sp. RSA 1824]
MTQHPSSPAAGAGSFEPADGSTGAKAVVQHRVRRSTTRNSSLLLRLFTSQFFDSWLAVGYIFRYPELVGVQHYLCNELRKFPREEVEFFLPQLVHLLITRPNESTAVESLLMDMAVQSAHVAMILYWYLQAFLSDLSPNPRTASFKHCQRIFNQVQELLFTDMAPELIIDAPEPVQHAYLHAMENVTSTVPRPGSLATLSARFRAMFRLAPQVRENAHAALVGISSAITAPGAPALASMMGWVAVAEGQTVKLSEKTGEDYDLPPQSRSLAGRTRGTNSPLRAQSAASYSRQLSGNTEQRGRHTNDTRQLLSTQDSNKESNPPIPGFAQWAPASLPATAGASYDRTWGTVPTREHTAISENADESGDKAQRRPRIPQHMFVGSGTPTPARRASTDSCRTVAIMEGLSASDLAQHELDIEPDLRTSDDIGTTRLSACRSYIDKATRQFQRNARQIGRRLSRSYGGFEGLPPGSSCSLAEPWSQHVEIGEAMRANLEGMSTYMEKERTKLERRTGYFSAEIKFVTALMDISQRVCAVPKVGRQQFLKAELTLFNHALDRNACIPLWCSEASGACHHRIVRIPTEDTVVLNSAERAPYLLTLEVLEPTDADHTDQRPPHLLSAANSSMATPTSTNTSISVSPNVVLETPALVNTPEHSALVHSPAMAVSTSPAHPQAPASPGSVRRDTPLLSPTTAGSTLSHVSPAISKSASVMAETKGKPSTSTGSQPLSPSVAEDVDEKLMAEVFGDIDDISDIPRSPLSPDVNRRRSGSYSGGHFGDRAASNRRSMVFFSDGSVREPTSLSPQPVSNSGFQSVGGQVQAMPTSKLAHTSLHTSISATGASSATSRVPTSPEDIRARMRTASILLAQLARQQKALGIKVANLVVSQPVGGSDSDSSKTKPEASDAAKRRSKHSNATTQALVMEEIREKLVREMMQLEELRLKQPGLDSAGAELGADAAQGIEDDIDVREVEFKDDPSAKVLKEDWETKKARIRRASPYGRQKNWNLLSVIVKEGADLRQEQLALQLIREMQRIWNQEQSGLFVQYYRIMVTGEGCGIMETITNTVSVHSIKKEFYSRNPGYTGPPYTLYNYFVTSYGTPDTARFREAQDCFMRSLASYSLITYVLQIRDRHNGNILLDTAGHVIHIDFGFMLYNSPGSVGFEQAPFKFPMEYVDILGGRESTKFAEFRRLLVTAFLALRKHADNVCLLVEMMIKDSPLPCLGGGPATVAALRERFHLALSESQIEELVNTMLVSSCDNITTRMYDAFQYYSNGIL